VAEQHMRSSEDVLNKGLGDFEHHRVMEMKEFLRRYVRNQIYFHAKSIEGLTAAYGEIVKIDPDTEKAIFLRRIRDLEYQNKGNPQMRQDQQQAQAQAQQQAADVAAGRPQQLQQQQPQPLMSPQNFGR
jgi:hypothetical protein